MSAEEFDKSGNLEALLLDSSLISGVRFTKTDFKIVRCGDYLQVYFYTQSKLRDNTKNLDVNGLKNKKITSSVSSTQTIRSDNILRSKLNCQRLAKANADAWKSFITLTYSDNMQDLEKAKKDFNYFVKNIKKIKSDFKYIVILEFQKRGAIHFHFLSNLTLQDNFIITKQKSNEKYYDVKYWNKGFTSYEPLDGDLKKIIGYISKYMTKDCDNRLFNFKRYSYSQNLIKPIEEYVNIEEQKEYNYFKDLLNGKECIYTNTYQDMYQNDIIFMEFE